MWLILALVSAFTDACRSIILKKNIHKLNPVIQMFSLVSISLLILIPVMFYKGIPQLDSKFWIVALGVVIADTIAAICYIFAIKMTDLSLSLPMLALTPVVVLFSGMVINKEFPELIAIVGVFLVVIGIYLLNLNKKSKYPLAPIKAIYEDKGVLTMFLVAILWGLVANFRKIALEHSNPYFYTGFNAIGITLLLIPISIKANFTDFKNSFKLEQIKSMAPASILDGLSVLTLVISQSLTFSVLTVSIKRLSVLFSAILACILFKEKISNRIVPIGIIVVGAICISIS